MVERMENRTIPTLAIFATLVLVVLDGAIANLALPSLTQAFAIPPAQAVQVMTAYQLGVVMALLPAAALGEGFGYRRLFTLGVALFTLASALCCAAPSFAWLVAARFLQGLGGAAVMGLTAALFRVIYPPDKFGRVLGWNAMVIALSAAAGPTIGAAILARASWPWLFAINLPVGALVLIASRGLPKTEGSRRWPDPLSVGLNALLFGCVVVGVDRFNGWLLAIGAVSLIILVRRERRKTAPLIPLDLLRLRPFALGVIASICCFTASMAGMVALPFYLQQGLGVGTLRTGLYMTLWPAATAFAAPLAGRLADKVSTAWLCAVGGSCLAGGLVLAALSPSLPGILAGTVLCGAGFGFFQTPNNRTMLLSAPRERSGAAGGMQGTARLSGQTAGALIMTVLFALAPSLGAPRIGLALAACFALAGGAVSALRISSSSAP